MRFFLFGDPYYLRTVIRCLDYTHPECSDVYLSNNLIADKILYSSKYNIRILTDIIIDDSKIDELFIISSRDILPFLCEGIAHLKTKRRIIRMDKMPIPKYSSRIFDNSLLKDRPSILSLSVGKGAQQYFSELLINKKLKERKIRFHQHFSPETAYLLSNNNLNSPLVHKDNYSENYDIFVGGVSINHPWELLNLNLSTSKAILNMHPDSAIISCSNSPSLMENEIKIAADILYYQYRIKNIIVVISEYYSNFNVSFPMRTEYRQNGFFYDTLYLSDIDFNKNENILDYLLSSVYLPNGMIMVE